MCQGTCVCSSSQFSAAGIPRQSNRVWQRDLRRKIELSRIDERSDLAGRLATTALCFRRTKGEGMKSAMPLSPLCRTCRPRHDFVISRRRRDRFVTVLGRSCCVESLRERNPPRLVTRGRKREREREKERVTLWADGWVAEGGTGGEMERRVLPGRAERC